jgi:hemerythrin-like domain-containing protein
MLVATYSILAISAEQKKERGYISCIQKYLQEQVEKLQAIDPVWIASQLDELTQFAESRHQRKVEGFLIPAVRKATFDTGPLLADLESLSRVGGDLLRSVRQCLRYAFSHDTLQNKLLHCAIDRYIQNLLERLVKEEQELLPLAQRVISSDGWFAIGTMFLAHDANLDEQNRTAQGKQLHEQHHAADYRQDKSNRFLASVSGAEQFLH